MDSPTLAGTYSDLETPSPLAGIEAGELEFAQKAQVRLARSPSGAKLVTVSRPGSIRSSIDTPRDSRSTTDSRGSSRRSRSESSASQTYYVEGPNDEESTKLDKDFFAPRPAPEKRIVGAIKPPLPAKHPARSNIGRSDEAASSNGGPSGSVEPAVWPRQETRLADAPDEEVVPEHQAVAAAKEKPTAKTIQRGQRNIKIQKFLATLGLLSVNFMFIFATWWWPSFWYIYLPFISFPLVLNCAMIASIFFFQVWHRISPEKKFPPDHKESLVMIIPCYNETVDECTRSLDSLVDQVGIEEHKKAIMVICDGRVRGPGMEKTTADYLFEDILVNQTHRQKIKRAYTGWNGESMDVEVAQGNYKGVPFYCIVKEQNQGKRDSLIVVRSFLYKFNLRNTNPQHIFSSRFFSSLTRWLSYHVEMDQVDHLIGMDADTVFAPDCILELLKESTYANTVGVCGYVAVDFSGGNWNLWSLYQNAEYSIAQALRRLHQSIATHKVSCLPGCCQLLRICEVTCGDEVLVKLFGYHPAPTDGMLKQIRATASEDRNHVCLMLTQRPQAQTRQALRAKAYTDVPHSWSVFLSQRRRWTLGATSNDLLLFTARHCQWWERIVAFSNVLTWTLNVFVIASIGVMIVAFMSQPVWIIMIFVGVMLIPITYYIGMVTWLPSGIRERFQYLAGLALFVFCGPFLNITVMVFAVWNMDSFGWGKTRMVVKADDEASGSDEKSSDAGRGSPAGNLTGSPETAAVASGGRSGGVLPKPRNYDEEAGRDALATNAMRSTPAPPASWV